MPFLRPLACLAFVAVWAAGAAAEISRADARAMMERSGMVAQLSDEAEQIRESFPKTITGQVPADLVQPLTEVVVEAWGGTRLLDAVEVAYADILTPEDLAAINAFIDTSLGQKVIAAETAGSSTEAWNEIEARRGELIAELEADKERSAVVRRIDSALNATAVSATIMMSLVRASVVASAGNADPETLAQVEEFIETMKPSILDDNRQYILASFSRIYAGLSTEDLTDYADYLETGPAKTMNGAFFAVANEHYIAVGEAVGQGMAELFRQKRS